MLARARFRDDALLAHAAGEQDLAEHIVDLVGAGVVELVALEIDFGAAELFGQPLGEIERARAPDIVLEQVVELGLERRVGLGGCIGLLERQDERHQRLGDEASPVDAETAALVRALAIGIGLLELAHSFDSLGRTRERASRRSDERLDPGDVLDPGRALDARGDVDAAGAGQRDRRSDIVGVETAGKKPGAPRREIPRQAPVEGQTVAAWQAASFGGLASISSKSATPS